MAQTATTFRARLMAEPGGKTLPVPLVDMPASTLQLDNTIFAADTFRRGHVETFGAPGRFCGLHVCVFPHVHDCTAIFGLDMVAGPARVSGIYLDLSPVTEGPPAPRLRDVADALAIRPADADEVARALDLAEMALDAALAASRERSALGDATAGQARYVTGQRRNEPTWRMLAGFIGPEPARRFIDEVLFPL